MDDMHTLDMYCEELMEWSQKREDELQHQLTLEELVVATES